MHETQKVLIEAIGKQLFPDGNIEPDAVGPTCDWRAVLNGARQQAMFPIAYHCVKDRLPDDLREEYELVNLTCCAGNIRNKYQHFELNRLLTSHSIPYVILKGQASAMYYPEPMLRTMGDVDFLVGHDDLSVADALLKANGFCRTGSDNHEFHWAYRRGNASFEMHWDIPGVPEKDNTTIRRCFSDILKQTQTFESAEGSFMVPSVFHHGLVLLLHTISHLTGSGVGLRHLCDWLVFEDSLSEERFVGIFEKPLKEIGLWTFAKVLTQIGVVYFGCRARSWCQDADIAVCEGLLEDILNGGNFGVKDGTRESQAKLIQNDLTKKIPNGGIWKNALVSIHMRARKDFPFLKKLPVLFPLCWVIVIVQYAIRVMHGTRNNVLEKETFTEIRSRQKLYAALCLFENKIH